MKRFGINLCHLLRRSGKIEILFHTVVCAAAAVLHKEIQTIFQRLQKTGKACGIDGAHLCELRRISTEAGILNVQHLAGPEGGTHGKADLVLLFTKLLMPLKIIHGIVCGAKHLDLLHAKKILHRECRGLELCVGLIPDGLGSSRRQGRCDAEVALQLQVCPVIEGISDTVLNGIGPGQELLIGIAVAGDQGLRDTVGAHGAPFVVVSGQPDLGQVAVAFVFPDLLGIQMVVEVNDRHILCRIVKEIPGSFCLQQKIFIHKSFHQDCLRQTYFSRVARTAPTP